MGRALMCGALLWGTAWGIVAAQDAGPAAPNGFYTESQAARGREEYITACAHCHRSDLLGDIRQEIPSLAEDDFFVRWGGRSAAALFNMISRDMPMDKPGQLSVPVYVDILAYILQVNGYAAGANELRADTEALGRIVLEAQP